MRNRRPALERFWRHVQKTEGCWLWTGSKKKGTHPYGFFGDGTKTVKAHRFSYATFVGAIPSGLGVLHNCDTPDCVRPDHLFLGTQRDNIWDCKRKGRARYNRVASTRGEERHNAKLTDEDVLTIRKPHAENAKVLAKRYGVDASRIRRIIRGESWAHVKELAGG